MAMPVADYICNRSGLNLCIEVGSTGNFIAPFCGQNIVKVLEARYDLKRIMNSLSHKYTFLILISFRDEFCSPTIPNSHLLVFFLMFSPLPCLHFVLCMFACKLWASIRTSTNVNKNINFS
jgi:hypothetical protein